MLIVADDLTGAADAAAPFATAGHRTSLLRSSWRGRHVEPDADVLTVDTNGRTIGRNGAARLTQAVIAGHPGRPVMIKIDSTLRGHVAATVRAGATAAALAHGAVHVVICPAVIGQRRSVRDAVVHVDGAPLAGGDLSVLAAALSDEEMRSSVAAITVGDAATDADLDRLVSDHRVRLDARPASAPPVLWVGAAGLAAALARATPAERPSAPHRPAAARPLIVAGSQQARTAAQLDRVVNQRDVVRVDPRHPLDDAARRRVLDADALVLTGGHTAATVTNALGVEAWTIGGELISGLPWSLVRTHDGRTIVVVTKAGGFGGDDALMQAIAALRRSSSGAEST